MTADPPEDALGDEAVPDHEPGPVVAPAPRHTLLDDFTGLATGVLLMSLALYLLDAGGVVTGGVAGLALLLGQVLPIPFTVLFVVINLPFFALAVAGKGWVFTLRSLACVAVVAGLAQVQVIALGPLAVPAVHAAVMGNVLAGVGMLILFRHGASMGGFSVVGLLAQERLGWRAGYVQMGLDAAVVLASIAVVGPLVALISAAGAVALNGVLALNHRPGRYLGH